MEQDELRGRPEDGASTDADGESVAAVTPDGRTERPPLGLPAIPITDVVVLPQMIVPLHLDSWAHVRAVEMAMLGGRQIFLLSRSSEAAAPESPEPGQIGL